MGLQIITISFHSLSFGVVARDRTAGNVDSFWCRVPMKATDSKAHIYADIHAHTHTYKHTYANIHVALRKNRREELGFMS